MILLALRLVFADGRRAALLFLVTLVTAAICGSALLLVLSVKPALQARADRSAWDFGAVDEQLAPSPEASSYTAVYSSSLFCPCGQITRVYLAPRGPKAPLFPGLNRQPGPGEVYLSPKLAELTRSSPELSSRYGNPSGLVSNSVLAGPDSLMAVKYLPLKHMPPLETRHVTKFGTSSDRLDRSYGPGVLEALIAVGGIALLVPIVLLLSTVIRLSTASRERRTAALRLAGATRGQVAFFTCVESGLIGAGGAALGAGLFHLVRPWAAHVSADERWFVTDITPPTWAFTLISAGVPLLVVGSALLTLRRAAVSPLGTARRELPHRLSKWRLVPVVLGALGASGMLVSGAATSLGGARLASCAFAGLLGCLLLVGPWLTRTLGRQMAAHGRLCLVVGRRIEDDPQSTFRAVSGVILAVFISTVFTAATPAAVDGAVDPGRRTGLAQGAGAANLGWTSPDQAQLLLNRLRAVPGVSAAILVFEGTSDQGDPIWIADCEPLARIIKFSTQQCGQVGVLAGAAARSKIWPNGPLAIPQLPAHALDPSADPVTLTVPRVNSVGVLDSPSAYDTPTIVVSPELVGKDLLQKVRPNKLLLFFESAAALETARTIVDKGAPGAEFTTRYETIEQNTVEARRIHYALLAVVIGSFAIAGLSLASTVTIGLLERRRQYALLRMTVVSISQVRLVMFLEAAAPLLVSAILAASLGAVVALGILGFAGLALPTVWALAWPLAMGIGIALMLVCCALPAVGPATATSEVRFE